MWALLPVFAAADSIVAPSKILAVGGFVFGVAFCNTITSDIKDLEDDKTAGILTIPVALGKARAIRLLHVLNVVFCSVTVLFALLGILPTFFVLTEINTIVFAVILTLLSATRKEWIVSELGLDAASILLPVWCLFGQYLLQVRDAPW